MGQLLEFLRLMARKAATLFVVFLLASTALFIAVRAVPGDPVALRLKSPDPVRVAEERARLGLDQPVVVQWWRSVTGFVRGDWGRSLLTGRTVRADVAEFLPATLELSLAGLALGVLLGVATALGAEVARSGVARRLSFLLGTVGMTVPIFWIGLIALVVGSGWLGWFPTGGRLDLAVVPPPVKTGLMTLDAILAGDAGALWAALHHLALPALCLSLYPAAQVCSVLQARLQDRRLRVLATALRARGLGPMRIGLRHLSRLVGAPILTVVASNFGALLGGAVLTETVFSWPGLGRHVVAAVLGRDLYVVHNVLLMVVLLVVVVVQATDLLARSLDPAARSERPGTAEEGS